MLQTGGQFDRYYLRKKTRYLMKIIKDNQNQSKTITRKINGIIYEVTIHFSKTSRETMNDKITRLIRNEVAS